MTVAQQPAPRWFVAIFSAGLLAATLAFVWGLIRTIVWIGSPSPSSPALGADVPQAAMATPHPLAGDVSNLYSITRDDDVAGLNRKIDVLLYKREKQATLEVICQRIHKADAHKHEITFLFFDVRGVAKPKGFAHWAIARFEPDLFVQIFGDE